MTDTGFRYLNLEKIFMYEDDECHYPIISFEQSEQGIWLSLQSLKEFNECLKEIIALAINCGFNWKDGDGEKQFATRMNQLETLNDDSSLDRFFGEALEYLNELALNDDPGWQLTFDRSGLLMQSIWSDESDMWDESREERPPTPSFGSDVIRKMLQSGL